MRMRAFLGFLVILLLSLVVAPALAVDGPVEWQGDYAVSIVWVDGKVIPCGTETRGYFPAERDGELVQGFEHLSRLNITVMGTAISITEMTLSYASLEHDPLSLEVRMAGGHGDQRMVVDFAPERVVCRRDPGAPEARTTECEVPAGVTLRDPDILWDPGEATVGELVEAWGFSPLSLKIQKTGLTYRGKETIETSRGPVEAHRIEIDDEMLGPNVTWTDDAGMILRQEFDFQGLKMAMDLVSGGGEAKRYAPDDLAAARAPSFVDMSAEQLPAPDPAGAGEAGEGGESPDLLMATLVDCGGEIPDARRCREMRVRVEGLDRERLFIASDRQLYGDIAALADGSFGADLTVLTETPPETGAPLESDPPEDVASYLQPSQTIQSDDPEIVAQAREIVGDETDSWKAALAIANWVVENMTPTMQEALLRSAKEVYESRRGECRSYSALTCALCRAVGIPTRIAAGAVYLGDALGPAGEGKFGFHAWNEVWVGRWVALDTAFPGPEGVFPVDATHIKFADGEVSDITMAARVVRSLRLTLVSADTADEEAAWGGERAWAYAR